MTLLVDTQHGVGHSGDLSGLLRRYIVPQSLVEDVRLDFGDAMLIGNGPGGTALRIGIEVKHVADALTCMESGRLSGLDGQIEGMHRDYDLSWLVVQDDLRPDSDTGMLMKKLSSVRYGRRTANRGRGSRGKKPKTTTTTPSERFVPVLFGHGRTITYAALMKWLTSLQVMSIYEYGKPLFVWNTKTSEETAQWIVAQYRYWTDKEFEAHKSMRLFNTSLWDKSQTEGRRTVGFMSEARKRRVRAANVFDGIGYDRAVNLAGKFSSIEEMYGADVEGLVTSASVDPRSGKKRSDGVGETLAKKMWEQIRERRR